MTLLDGMCRAVDVGMRMSGPHRLLRLRRVEGGETSQPRNHNNNNKYSAGERCWHQAIIVAHVACLQMRSRREEATKVVVDPKPVWLVVALAGAATV